MLKPGSAISARRWGTGTRVLALLLLLGWELAGRVRAGSFPENAYVSGVVGHAQSYTLSCEARSAVDWAAFWGVQIGEAEFLDRLPRSDNPDAGFVGQPNDLWGNTPPRGYGVHAGPVAALLREYGMQAEAHRGLSWDDLRAEVSAGRPVIVWIIGQMWSGRPAEYTASDGEKATVARFEHTMILIGYDSSVVHVVDAYSGWTQAYPLNTFLASWGVLGQMAILGRGPEAPPEEVPAGGSGGTYTVQRGDYLVALADRFDTTWQELARLNNLYYPYTIYPGQVLQLPGTPEPPPPPPTATPTLLPSLPIPAGKYRLFFPLLWGGQVALTPEPTSQPPPAQPQSPPETYVVQPGDFLVALAESLDMDWRTLASINNLAYPFVIYPGQVLKLK